MGMINLYTSQLWDASEDESNTEQFDKNKCFVQQTHFFLSSVAGCSICILILGDALTREMRGLGQRLKNYFLLALEPGTKLIIENKIICNKFGNLSVV